MKFVADKLSHVPHILIKTKFIDYDTEQETEHDIEQTACGKDLGDFFSPELGDPIIGYDSKLPDNLCLSCKSIYDAEREALRNWNSKALRR